MDELFDKSPKRVQDLMAAAKGVRRKRERAEWWSSKQVEGSTDRAFTGPDLRGLRTPRGR